MHLPTKSPDDFVIRGGGDAFAMRQKQMFEKLSEAAKEFKKEESCSSLSETGMETICNPVTNNRNARAFVKHNRNNTMQYRGRESIFKRPEGPAPQPNRKSVPDHHRNPHKWIKYSLEDVPSEQMSDKSNAQAAFSFLKELKARKAIERSERAKNEEMEVVDCPENGLLSSSRCKFVSHVLYRKTSRSRTSQEPSVVVIKNDDKPVFRNSKIILPEYVVGQKQERKAKLARPIVKVNRSKQLKLDHLEELDE